MKRKFPKLELRCGTCASWHYTPLGVEYCAKERNKSTSNVISEDAPCLDYRPSEAVFVEILHDFSKSRKSVKKAKMTFEEALRELKSGKMIRRSGDPWIWRGSSGQCYYGNKRNHPMHFCDSLMMKDIMESDWEVTDDGAQE